jgi:hypothetical protein
MRDNLSQRLRRDVPRTFADYIAEVAALTGVFSGLMLLGMIWGDLPGEIPRHFGLTGEPTAWAGRWSAVGPVIIAVALYVGLTLLARVPHVFNYPFPITEQNAAIQYRLGRSMVIWLKAICVWMMISIVWSQARVALGDAEGVSPFLIFGFLIGLHVTIGIFIYRAFRHRHGESQAQSNVTRS